jgi:hypothetical protein
MATVTVCFGLQEGAFADGGHGVHAAQQMPADEPAHEVAVLSVGQPLQGLFAPGLVADASLVAPRKGAVLDQQPADVLAGGMGRRRVQGVVSDGGPDGEFCQESLDVALVDPGQAAIGACHGFQGRGHRLQRRGHGAGLGAGQQPVDGCPEDTGPASPAGVQFGFGSAAGAVQVEPDAAAAPAGRATTGASGQDSLVAAGAGAGDPLGGLIAVPADAGVRPGGRDLVVFAAASARLGPPVRVAGLAGPTHPVGLAGRARHPGRGSA